MALLDMLPEYAEKLDAKTVTDKIWPHLVRNSHVYVKGFDVEHSCRKPALQTLWRLFGKRPSDQ